MKTLAPERLITAGVSIPKYETTNNEGSPAQRSTEGQAALERPVSAYPLRRGGRAVPDRSRAPDIGAACHDTRKDAPAPSFTEENSSGVDVGTPTENTKSRQEHGDAVAEARHGQPTRPARPGRHWQH
ncbi:MAG: hypothetical protein ACRD0V_09945 [Acidimicrobiales bacterium]